MSQFCTCDGAGRGPGRKCVVKAGGRLGDSWVCREAAPQAPTAAPDDALRYRWLQEHTVAAGLGRFIQSYRKQLLSEAVDAAMQAPDAPPLVAPLIEYENDVGPADEGLCEWWTVSDGTRSFKCDGKADADWLCVLLNVVTDTKEKP